MSSLVTNIIPAELISKYSIAGPRYTSYPTALEFSSAVDSEVWSERLISDAAEVAEESGGGISVYLHVPFCRKLCYFCACYKVISKDRTPVAPFIEAVKREVRAYRELIPRSQKISQSHWGGGTPNFLTPEEIEELFGAIVEALGPLDSDADISIELDPRTTDYRQLLMLKKLGFNRISLGVQDFDIKVQTQINRIQPFSMTRDLIAAAREQGIKSVNTDLIYGLPGQTLSSFSHTIKQLISLQPDRLALYGYAHVPWVSKTQNSFNKLHLPTPRERTELFSTALNYMLDGGYEYLGMDHFALPDDDLSIAAKAGRLHRNFMGYTVKRSPLLIGLGPSAISMSPSCFAQNGKELAEYCQATAQTGLATRKGITRSFDDRLRGYVIEELMCNARLNFWRIKGIFGESFGRYFERELAALDLLSADGLLDLEGDRIKVTPLGRFFLRNIAMVFDAYLPAHREEGVRQFSQSV